MVRTLLFALAFWGAIGWGAFAVDDSEVIVEFNEATGITTLSTPNGIAIDIEGKKEDFESFLEASPAEEVGFRNFRIAKPMELGEFCRDLGTILDCTVVVPANLRKLIVPDVTLRRVKLSLALQTISETAGGQFQLSMDQNGDAIRSGNVVIRVEDLVGANAEGNIVVGRIFQLPQGDETKKSAQESLEEILDVTKSAIETLATAKGHPISKLPTIKLHPQTRLLIVAGTIEEIEIVGSVVKAMGGDMVEVPNVRGTKAEGEANLPGGGGGGGMF